MQTARSRFTGIWTVRPFWSVIVRIAAGALVVVVTAALVCGAAEVTGAAAEELGDVVFPEHPAKMTASKVITKKTGSKCLVFTISPYIICIIE